MIEYLFDGKRHTWVAMIVKYTSEKIDDADGEYIAFKSPDRPHQKWDHYVKKFILHKLPDHPKITGQTSPKTKI